MHEFTKFIRHEMAARQMKQTDLAARSGLSRQHVSKIFNDKREHLGQMPDDATIVAIASAFDGVTETQVRTAAARSLSRYSDDGQPLTPDLGSVSIDTLLAEIRRRVIGEQHGLEDATQPDASSKANEIEEAKLVDGTKVSRERGRRAGPDAAARARAKRPQNGRQQG